MLDYAKSIVSAVEQNSGIDNREQALKALRDLGLADFGLLSISMPNGDFPRLSSLLPKMASSDVQVAWTGRHGVSLLEQTCAFVSTLVANFIIHTGLDPASATVLDYGCGYGRILRLMQFFTPERQIFGVDPWTESIRHCQECGLETNICLSDYLPSDLPIPHEVSFDLIYAFSVFTHTSLRATRAALHALRKRISPRGLLAITIRPVEYWKEELGLSEKERADADMAHRETGFAFVPHQREAVDGEITYGDTSMDLRWLAANFPEWKIVGIDRSLTDHLQLYVFLKPF